MPTAAPRTRHSPSSGTGTAWSMVAIPSTSTTLDNEPRTVCRVSPRPSAWPRSVMPTNGTADQSLAEQWNGTAWSIVAIPEHLRHSRATTSERRILCQHLVLRGCRRSEDRRPNQALAEQWNGTAWSMVAIPSTSATLSNTLYGVSCVTRVVLHGRRRGRAPPPSTATSSSSGTGSVWSIQPAPSRQRRLRGRAPLRRLLRADVVRRRRLREHDRQLRQHVHHRDVDVERLRPGPWRTSPNPPRRPNSIRSTGCRASGGPSVSAPVTPPTAPAAASRPWSSRPPSPVPAMTRLPPTAASSTSGAPASIGSLGSLTAQQADRRHGRHPGRRRLLAGGLRRRHLRQGRRRLLRLARRASPSTSRSSAWPPTPDGQGYWLVASDGGIFAKGDAGFFGSLGQPHPQQADRRHGRRPPTGRATGWWPPTAASSPRATPASSARTGSLTLNKPVVGMAADPRRPGLLAGGLRRRHLRQGRRRLLRLARAASSSTSPWSAWPPTPDGHGYWLVASDGGIFAKGDAGFLGSEGGTVLNKPVVGMGA